MTDQQRLDAIISRLGVIETNSATAHAQIQGGIDVLTERVSTLADRVAIQNGRVTKLEGQVGDLQMKAKIAEREIAEDGDRHDVIATRIWQFLSGASLVGLGALLGHFL